MSFCRHWVITGKDAFMTLRFWLFILLIPPLFLIFPLPMALKGGILLLWGFLALFVLIQKVITPVDQVKDAALNLASGHFEEIHDPHGPQEVREIATALQTLRECLMDSPHPPSDKLYGEYECAELLQFEMLDKMIEKAPLSYEMKKASLPSSHPKALRLIWQEGSMEVLEAEEEGFQGTFKLLTDGSKKRIKVYLSEGYMEVSGMPEPLLWSNLEKKLMPFHSPQKGDILILINSGLTKQLPHPQALKDWLTKILKHFAKDSLSLTAAMMQSELTFFAKKYLHHEDLHILLLQIN